MHGCCGHMGQVISQIVKEDADAQIVAGIDPFDNGKMEYPVYKSLEDCKEEADVVIDFASAKAEDAPAALRVPLPWKAPAFPGVEEEAVDRHSD